MNDHVNGTMAGILNSFVPKETAPPSVPVQADVRPWWERTSRGYDVFGPDSEGLVSVENDVDCRIVWLSREDVEKLLARWPNDQAHVPTGAERKEVT